MYNSEDTFHTTVNGLFIYSKETVIGIDNGRAILKPKEIEPDYNQLVEKGNVFSCDKKTLPFYIKRCPSDGIMINFKGNIYTFIRLNEINYDPFFTYIFYKIRKVDHIYSYFVKDSKFIPLKRNKTWTRFIFPWLLIGKHNYNLNGEPEFREFSFESLDSLSEFFATLLKLEN